MTTRRASDDEVAAWHDDGWVLGSAEQQKRGVALLGRHRARIQGLVAGAIVLKYTPRLRFLLDDSIARGNRVLGIIDDLEKSLPPDAKD